MRKLVLYNRDTVVDELARIGVDPEAFPIFIEKASYDALKLDGLSCAQASVLKQIALVNGADVAVPKNVYQGMTRKKISVIVFANRRELIKIAQRLEEQPWLHAVGRLLKTTEVDDSIPSIRIGKKKISFERTYVMGVINVTPDSFYSGSRYTNKDTIVRVASEMEQEGTDFIDIGAESSRPGTHPTHIADEMKRLQKIIPAVVRHVSVPVSIDTYKADVARFAIDHGVKIVNDISGLRFDKRMINIIARHRVGLVIMHMRGKPRTMQVQPHYHDLMGEISEYFENNIKHAVEHHIKEDRIIIDPGLGFGKNMEDNYKIINRLKELTVFNRPILVGHSRKSFIGVPFDQDPEQRLEGTLGVGALLVRNGVSILRVHDVLETKKVTQLIDRIVR